MSDLWYLEHCMETARTIEIGTLSTLQALPEVGRGASHLTRPIGLVGMLGGSAWAALKVPHTSTVAGNARVRLEKEITAIETLTHVVPSLRLAVPGFMCMVAIGQESPSMILTEDASKGGIHEVKPHIDTGLLDEIKAAVAVSTLEGLSTSDQSIVKTLSHEVQGKRRLLDLTPVPIQQLGKNKLVGSTVTDAVYDETALTVRIDAESPLAVSLRD